jgi:hypothetical protein
MEPGGRQLLGVRAHEACRTARSCTTELGDILQATTAVKSEAARLRFEARSARDRSDYGAASFEIVGMIEERVVSAQWTGTSVDCSAELRTRAELLVAMEETFDYEGCPSPIRATLDDSPVALFLTLTRACDKVTSASFVFGSGGWISVTGGEDPGSEQA